MIKNRLKATLMLSLALMFSCTSVAHLQSDDYDTTLTASQASSIEVYSVDDIERDYEALGSVVTSADGGNNANTSVRLLKEQAAKLGADAIVNLKLRHVYGFWGIALEASGTAVKFKK